MDTARRPAARTIVCALCGQSKITVYAQTRYCSDACQRLSDSRRRKVAYAAKKDSVAVASKPSKTTKQQRVITCAGCGKVHCTTSPLTVYCSAKCAGRAYYLRKKNKLLPDFRALGPRPPCPHCGGTHITKLSRDKNGKQRYRCHNPDCATRSFILYYEPTEHWEARRKLIISMAIEGKRVRETARILGITPAIVTRIRKKDHATILAAWEGRGFQ